MEGSQGICADGQHRKNVAVLGEEFGFQFPFRNESLFRKKKRENG